MAPPRWHHRGAAAAAAAAAMVVAGMCAVLVTTATAAAADDGSGSGGINGSTDASSSGNASSANTNNTVYTVTMGDKPLGLRLSPTLAVLGFHREVQGVALQAEASGWVRVGDTLEAINDVELAGLSLAQAQLRIMTARAPKVLRLRTGDGSDRTATMAAVVDAGGGTRRLGAVGGVTGGEMGRIEVEVNGKRLEASPAFMQAAFGGPITCTSGMGPLVASHAVHGCMAHNEPVVTGAVLVVARGACSFADKAILAQAAGAAALVVVNSDDGLEAAPWDPHEMNQVSLPVVMVSRSDGPVLRAVALPEGFQGMGAGAKPSPTPPPPPAATARVRLVLNSAQCPEWGADSARRLAADAAAPAADTPLDGWSTEALVEEAADAPGGDLLLFADPGGNPLELPTLVRPVEYDDAHTRRAALALLARTARLHSEYCAAAGVVAPAPTTPLFVLPAAPSLSACVPLNAADMAAWLTARVAPAAGDALHVAVLVERGGCTSRDKVGNVQAALAAPPLASLLAPGGHALFIANSEAVGGIVVADGVADLLQPHDEAGGAADSADADHAADAIPPLWVGTLSKHGLETALGMLRGGGTVSAVLAGHASVAAAWSELQAHAAPASWPAGAREARKEYMALSRFNHPDAPTGHPERFEFLAAAYAARRQPELPPSSATDSSD